jgi:hypothetical protein
VFLEHLTDFPRFPAEIAGVGKLHVGYVAWFQAEIPEVVLAPFGFSADFGEVTDSHLTGSPSIPAGTHEVVLTHVINSTHAPRSALRHFAHHLLDIEAAVLALRLVTAARARRSPKRCQPFLVPRARVGRDITPALGFEQTVAARGLGGAATHPSPLACSQPRHQRRLDTSVC